MKPEFICIGAQRAGTTWLYKNLQMQTGFSMLKHIKELHYFDRSSEYASQNDLEQSRFLMRVQEPGYLRVTMKKFWRRLCRGDVYSALWWLKFRAARYDNDWYLSLFEGQAGITGDVTPSYSIIDEKGVSEMYDLLPDAKIIMMIRNPIDRAWSMYRFVSKFKSGVDYTDFDRFKDYMDVSGQRLRSDYIRSIDLYAKYYGKENMLIGFYDAIQRDPQNLLSDVTRFLGSSEPLIEDKLRKVINESKEVVVLSEMLVYLQELYRDDITELASRYGSYALDWKMKLDGASSINQHGGDARHSTIKL